MGTLNKGRLFDIGKEEYKGAKPKNEAKAV